MSKFYIQRLLVTWARLLQILVLVPFNFLLKFPYIKSVYNREFKSLLNHLNMVAISGRGHVSSQITKKLFIFGKNTDYLIKSNFLGANNLKKIYP